MPITILVGIDGSTPSRSALEWSVARASATGAHLELLHVVDLEALTESVEEAEDLAIRADSLVNSELAYVHGIDPNLVVNAQHVHGRPADVLAEWSARFSLLVIGTHKTGFIYGRAFGSRFLDLGWRSRCDIAFVPDRLGHDRRGIVAAVDDSVTGDAVVRFAAAEAARASQELVLVSSWGSAAHPPRHDDALARRVSMSARAVALAKGDRADLRVRARAIEHPAAEALVEASAGAALLVIGRHRSAGGESSSGVANHDVLINMSSPVIVVSDN